MKPEILFICTGNIFRSLAAEHLTRAYLGPDSPFQVSSAGIKARPQLLNPEVESALKSYGIDVKAHEPRKLTSEILRAAALPIAMGKDHRDFIKQEFGVDVILYQELVRGRSEGILDIHEAIAHHAEHKGEVAQYIHETVDYLATSTPTLIEKAGRVLAPTLDPKGLENPAIVQPRREREIAQ